MTDKIGILHPGEMGISLAASAVASGQSVHWCGADRSKTTRKRAKSLKLQAVDSLQDLCDSCQVLISVCPPHAAEDLAADVIDCEFSGIYADVNAISPATSITIGNAMQDAGITYVDGGIIGLPPTRSGTTWLYLSGQAADAIAACFTDGPLETEVLGDEIGQASGLKMCFAANSKGTAALHTAILGAAEAMGVRQALEHQWDVFNPGFTEKSHNRIRQVARKAWRFTGEMHEIAATLSTNGMPASFHEGAAEIYERQKAFKDRKEEPSIEEVLKMVAKKAE